MDTFGNSIANTCFPAQLHGRAVLISFRTNPGFAGSIEVIHDK